MAELGKHNPDAKIWFEHDAIELPNGYGLALDDIADWTIRSSSPLEDADDDILIIGLSPSVFRRED